MGRRRAVRSFVVVRGARALVLSAGLVAVGLGVAFGLAGLANLREPFVDLTVRADAAATSPRGTEERQVLSFAVAPMENPKPTFLTYRRLVHWISQRVGRREAFVMLPSYSEMRRELEAGRVDVAFVCTGTYVNALAGNKVRLLVRPEFKPELEYRCLIIVPSQSAVQALPDLRGKIMAFTDPESLTGYLVPSTALIEQGCGTRTFFDEVIFTGSHDRSIQAVAVGVADAAGVDALVWQACLRENPSLRNQVRVLWQSEVFGAPPVVVPQSLERALSDSLRDAFLAMDKDAVGREILSDIGIRRFVLPQREDYQTAIDLYQSLQARGDVPWP